MITMTKKPKKTWVSATLSEINVEMVRQKSYDLFDGNFSATLDHIINTYRNIFSDLMMKQLMREVYDAYDRIREEQE
jgi:hypothetical protein